jgi:protein LSM12
MSKNGSTTADGSGSITASSAPPPLYVLYPVNSYMELTLAPTPPDPSPCKIQGTVYTTDAISNTIVILKSLPHTTLSFDVIIINASSVVQREVLHDSASDIPPGGNPAPNFPLQSIEEGSTIASLGQIQPTQLEERERRAVKLAMESLEQINSHASPHAQLVFDLLVKGCNKVSWSNSGTGTSIIVLNQIRVDPPFTPDSCTWIGDTQGVASEQKLLDEGSLDRVKRIVGSQQARALTSKRTTEN